MQAVLTCVVKCKNNIVYIFHARNASRQPIGIEDSACLHCLCFSFDAIFPTHTTRALACIALFVMRGNQALVTVVASRCVLVAVNIVVNYVGHLFVM